PAPRGREAQAIGETLFGVAHGERHAILESALQALAAAVLGHAAPRVDLETPLTQLGLDSLMAIELKNEIEAAAAVPIPVTTLITGPSLRELADGVLARITLDNLDRLSDADVGTYLRELTDRDGLGERSPEERRVLLADLLRRRSGGGAEP